MKNTFKLTALASALALTLSGCGGGGGSSSGGEDIAGIGGSGYIATGSITGFGSVYVNGVKFETDDTDFDIEGVLGTQDNLSIGMIVRVEGTINDDGVTGNATKIIFEDELQGPVTSISAHDPLLDTRTFEILGTRVIIDRRNTKFDDDDNAGFSFETIKDNDHVEISGFFDSTDTLVATYIDKENDLNNEVKIQGLISNLDSGARTFTINGQTVSYTDDVIDDDLSGGLSDGIWVEVEGRYDTNTSIVVASEVDDFDGDDFNDDDDIDIEGYITDYVDDSNFKVNGVTINASNLTLSFTLADDVLIDVEGTFRNGVLIAEEIELRDGEVEINAQVNQVNDDGSFTVTYDGTQTIAIETGFDTQFEYDDVNQLLNQGDFVEIDGYQTGDNTVYALEVDVEDESDYEIQGFFQSYNDTAYTIKVLNVDFTIDINNTEFDSEDGSMDNWDDFIANAVPNQTLISLELNETGTIVESVEIED